MQSPVWIPTDSYIAGHALTRFARHIERDFGVQPGRDYQALHRWSVNHREDFWRAILAFMGVIYSGSPQPAIIDGDALPGAHWYPELRLNYAENLLRHPADMLAVVATDESGACRAHTFGELRADVARHQQALAAAGVGSSDVVAAILPNRYEAVAAMLGAASLGATWCSVSPDFGAAGILDRFSQVAPRVLYAIRRYRYGGREFDITDKLHQVIGALPSLAQTVIVDGDAGPLAAVPLDRFLPAGGAPALQFERFAFEHPLYVLFTSGTTGVPKGIRHGAGGPLLQLLKEHVLHCDVRAGDRMFFPTTLGWMMWNWLINGLAAGSAIVLYDGSFTHPGPTLLFDIIERQRVNVAGMSGAFIESSRKAGLDLRATHRFGSVRFVVSGGSVLSPEAHVYASEKLFPGTPIASCSGGTDIVSSFLTSNPWGPIWPGELQAAALGMTVDVFDEQGRPVRLQTGELVCRKPAPSMPLDFVNDAGGRRHRSAYFERFAGVWAHGDFVTTTAHDGFVIYGRSDAVLNPGGVRIGTAEIYRPIDRVPGVLASVAVGEEIDGDVVIALFVKLAPGVEFTPYLEQQLRSAIRNGASPRHVPKRIEAVPDIPVTRSGKIAETAVREAVNGRAVRNIEALANPEALRFFAKSTGLNPETAPAHAPDR